MSGVPSIFRSGGVLAQLPERTRQAIREDQAQAEILIAWVQLAIVAAFAAVYGLAPQATMRAEPHFEPLPWVLGAYAGATLIRLGFAYARVLGTWLLSFGVFIDLGLLMALIWGFHVQYDQPPAFYLKVPTLLSAFIFIALRALRFEVRFVVLAGLATAAGWACLVAYAVVTTPGAVVKRDFVGYMTGNRILIGAEVEKVLVILVVTAVLALAITRARRLLVRAAVDGATAATSRASSIRASPSAFAGPRSPSRRAKARHGRPRSCSWTSAASRAWAPCWRPRR